MNGKDNLLALDGGQVPALLPDRYEFLHELGRGAQGRTFLARDRASDHLVAIKELDMKGVANWKGVELFEREAQVLESLDHPAIPAYIEVHHLPVKDGAGESFYLVQQFVEGKSFDRLIAEGMRLDEAGAAAFLKEMLEILAYLHAFDPPVIHRDIKPSNIIRCDDGSLALIDFGAVQSQSASAAASTIVGTSGYMPNLFGQAFFES